MKLILLILITLTSLSIPSFTWAQEPVIVFENMTKCSNFKWDEWTGKALKEFRMYVKRDGVDLPYVAIPPEATTIICTDVSVAPEAVFEVYVTAVGLLGTEGGPSNVLHFIYAIPPMRPGNFCMIGETQDGSTVVRCQ